MSQAKFKSILPLCLIGGSLSAFFPGISTAKPVEQSGGILAFISSSPISNSELSTMRGGYKLGNSVTAYFAFSQITQVDGKTTQSIIIPQITISDFNQKASAIIQGVSGTNVTVGTKNIELSTISGNTKSGVVSISPQTGNLAVITKNNNLVLAELLNNKGFSNVISNTSQASNIVSKTVITIATKGLQSSIQSQRTTNMILSNLQNSRHLIP